MLDLTKIKFAEISYQKCNLFGRREMKNLLVYVENALKIAF